METVKYGTVMEVMNSVMIPMTSTTIVVCLDARLLAVEMAMYGKEKKNVMTTTQSTTMTVCSIVQRQSAEIK